MGVEDNPYDTHEERTAAHDMVVFYTDGLIERRGESLDVGLSGSQPRPRPGPKTRGICATTSSKRYSSRRSGATTT